MLAPQLKVPRKVTLNAGTEMVILNIKFLRQFMKVRVQVALLASAPESQIQGSIRYAVWR